MAINPKALRIALASGTTIPYRKLLIATGAMPRQLSAGPPSKRIAYLRTFDDALAIRRALRPDQHVVVIGGGFIGLEVAASIRRRGVNVTVVEAMSRLLARIVPEEIAAAVEARHRAEGVRISCGVSVNRIEEGENSVSLALSTGSVLTADLLVVGIGVRPITGLAEAAGLKVANGIAVDEYLLTSNPAIYAAGDCCSYPLSIYGGRRVRLESWRNAQDQGALAARNMLGAGEKISSLPWFWSDQYDLTLQIAGLPDEGQQVVRRVVAEDAFLLFHLAADSRLVAVSGIGPGTTIARDIRLGEMLIARGAKPGVADLSSPHVKLKALLAAE